MKRRQPTVYSVPLQGFYWGRIITRLSIVLAIKAVRPFDAGIVTFDETPIVLLHLVWESDSRRQLQGGRRFVCLSVCLCLCDYNIQHAGHSILIFTWTRWRGFWNDADYYSVSSHLLLLLHAQLYKENCLHRLKSLWVIGLGFCTTDEAANLCRQHWQASLILWDPVTISTYRCEWLGVKQACEPLQALAAMREAPNEESISTSPAHFRGRLDPCSWPWCLLWDGIDLTVSAFLLLVCRWKWICFNGWKTIDLCGHGNFGTKLVQNKRRSTLLEVQAIDLLYFMLTARVFIAQYKNWVKKCNYERLHESGFPFPSWPDSTPPLAWCSPKQNNMYNVYLF
jgi:hypothetical protein